MAVLGTGDTGQVAPEGQAGLSHHTSSERATRCPFPRDVPSHEMAQPHGTQDWEVQQASPGQCRCESQDSVPPDREEKGRCCQRVRAGGRGGDEERAPGTGTNVRTQHSARTALSKYGRNKQTNDKK